MFNFQHNLYIAERLDITLSFYLIASETCLVFQRSSHAHWDINFLKLIKINENISGHFEMYGQVAVSDVLAGLGM